MQYKDDIRSVIYEKAVAACFLQYGGVREKEIRCEKVK